MKKPVITIYKYGETYIYNCDLANYLYKQNLINIKAIFYVLNIFYMLEKDKNGQYLNRDNIKPIFE